MAYIGKSPAIGNFVKLDAISTSSTNTYNLTLDSVAFTPESANHMLVSLNGVIQAPLTSFSVSGSTITFLPSSGTLSSSDSIDFIMVYGNVLDIGTPSDSTVTNAKTNFVSTSSSAGLQIKGDGTTDGTLQLNCSQNSHGIKLKSPPHSASASYTLTFPTTDGNNEEFLQTNGSGVLTWASAGGGITEADMWRLTSGFNSDQDPISSNLERIDDATFGKIGTGVSVSSGIWTFPSTGVWLVKMITKGNTYDDSYYSNIYGTANNSSYDKLAYGFSGNNHSDTDYFVFTIETFFNCTNVSTHKIKFTTSGMAGGGGTQIFTDTDANATCFQFIRLGDSV